MEQALNVEGTSGRFESALEGDHKCVPDCLNLAAVELGENGSQKPVVPLEQRKRARLIGLGPGAVADHVGEHDGGQSTAFLAHAQATPASQVKAPCPAMARIARSKDPAQLLLIPFEVLRPEALGGRIPSGPGWAVPGTRWVRPLALKLNLGGHAGDLGEGAVETIIAGEYRPRVDPDGAEDG